MGRQRQRGGGQGGGAPIAVWAQSRHPNSSGGQEGSLEEGDCVETHRRIRYAMCSEDTRGQWAVRAPWARDSVWQDLPCLGPSLSKHTAQGPEAGGA